MYFWLFGEFSIFRDQDLTSKDDLTVLLGAFDLRSDDDTKRWSSPDSESRILSRKNVALEIDPIVHENYQNPLSTSNDIALLKLAESVDLDVYTPACLAARDADYTGKNGRVYGSLPMYHARFRKWYSWMHILCKINIFHYQVGAHSPRAPNPVQTSCRKWRWALLHVGENNDSNSSQMSVQFQSNFIPILVQYQSNIIQVSIISDEECDAQTSNFVSSEVEGECITQVNAQLRFWNQGDGFWWGHQPGALSLIVLSGCETDHHRNPNDDPGII